jgi:CHAD domain-containing protein
LSITLKNPRYASEFFGAVFKRRCRLRAFLQRISELQDLLGTHNDGVMARKLLAELSVDLGADAEVAGGFILGWYARSVSIADAKLLKRQKSFQRCYRFWNA